MTALHGWLMGLALPLWWERGADRLSGGFHELLDEQGRGLVVPRRARVIGRQIWVYASAAGAGATGPWREAAEHGLDFMVSRHIRADGLIRSCVGPDGSPLGDDVRLYDQAFALLSLAAAAGAGIDPGDQSARADVILASLRRDWRAPAAGFVEHEDQAFQSNPHMHLFEAALAWEAIGGGLPWIALADDMGELALARFIDPERGSLGEFFDADWRPAPGLPGREIWPGHQFEWAWLLTRWGLLRGREDALAAARRLHAIGRDYGVDPSRQVAIDVLDTDFSVVSGRARLWPQTERMKSAAILADIAPAAERAVLAAEVKAAAGSLALYFQTPMPGLWWDKMLENGEFIDEPAPASSLYHIACAIWEAKARGLEV